MENIQPDLFSDAPVAPAFLFFDTETTGLPKSWRAPVTDLANWPRLVQLAYMAYDAEGNLLSSADTLVKPVGFTIPEEASKVHGITTERALRDGRDLAVVLNEFRALLDRAKYLIAHNMGYDEKIIGAEFLRNGMTDIPASVIKICTMHSTTEYCEIPGSYGYKWPKLMELHRKLFEVEFEGAHDALADVAATAKCFWELKKRGVIKA
ncbi:MAG: 3'-5' exonuclease [Elusimicrobiales bacterium]|nr:3'-5' exonuclease [Elusimicrobiales bacterium]